jgi:predicted AlkP superfamily phosphohydrolase/phosphomutase
MFTNAAMAGLLGSLYVAILVWQLNPSLSIAGPVRDGVLAALLLFYGTTLAVIFYVALLARQTLAAEPLSPGWISVSLLAWLSAPASAAAGVLMWLNLRGFQGTLEPAAARNMGLGVLAMLASALALLTIAVLHYSVGRRGSRLSAALLMAAITASVTLPIAIRGPAAPAPRVTPVAIDELPAVSESSRLVLIALDAASLDYIAPAVAEGRLPNFGKVLDLGASMHLATLRPTQPAPVWATVATGKFPPKHGVRSAAVLQAIPGGEPIQLLPDLCFAQALVGVGLLHERMHAADALTAAPIWSILSRLGLVVNVAGWPLTYPAQPVRGSLVSDRVPAMDVLAAGAVDPGMAYPPGILQTLPGAGAPREGDTPDLARADEVAAGTAPLPSPRDARYRQIASALEADHAAHFRTVRYDGLDAVGHRFLREAMPRVFGDVSPEEVRRYGQVLDRYYGFVDGEIGAAMAVLGENDLLLVVSGFGMQPVSLAKRILARLVGDPPQSGSHEAAPDGFLLAYGTQVAPGRLPLGSTADVAPTILYFFGLPVGRDMDGYARTDIFTPAFKAEHPIAFIRSYQR